MMKRPRKTVALLLLAIALCWILRFQLYPFKSKKVVLPNGTAVTVRLSDARRMEAGRVRIKMDFSYKGKKGEQLFIPNPTITRPKAVQIPRVSPEPPYDYPISYPQVGALDSVYFDLKADGWSIDIAQPLYIRTNRDVVFAELPLSVHAMSNAGTARVEVLALSKGPVSDDWNQVRCSQDGLRGNFCVRVRQSDPDGSLSFWAYSRCGNLGCTCTAELLTDDGRSVPMSESYVATRDCKYYEGWMNANPPSKKIGRRIIQAVTLGHLWITGGRGSTWPELVPDDGEWIYTFKVRNPSEYSKIRIKYILPPKPSDKVTVRFSHVPI